MGAGPDTVATTGWAAAIATAHGARLRNSPFVGSADFGLSLSSAPLQAAPSARFESPRIAPVAGTTLAAMGTVDRAFQATDATTGKAVCAKPELHRIWRQSLAGRRYIWTSSDSGWPLSRIARLRVT